MVFNQKHEWHLWHTCVSPCKIGSMDFYTSTRKKKISMTFGKILARRSKQRAWDLWAWVWREWEGGWSSCSEIQEGRGYLSQTGAKNQLLQLEEEQLKDLLKLLSGHRVACDPAESELVAKLWDFSCYNSPLTQSMVKECSNVTLNPSSSKSKGSTPTLTRPVSRPYNAHDSKL